MAKIITLESWGRTVNGIVQIDREHKKIQIVAENGLPYAICTAPLSGLAEDEYAIKTWTENEGMLLRLISNDIVKPPHRWIPSGFVNVPICRLVEEAE